MSKNLLDQIEAGRTDLVFDYLAAGHSAVSPGNGGIPLI
jgi:hypothetical protein